MIPRWWARNMSFAVMRRLWNVRYHLLWRTLCPLYPGLMRKGRSTHRPINTVCWTQCVLNDCITVLHCQYSVTRSRNHIGYAYNKVFNKCIECSGTFSRVANCKHVTALVAPRIVLLSYILEPTYLNAAILAVHMRFRSLVLIKSSDMLKKAINSNERK